MGQRSESNALTGTLAILVFFFSLSLYSFDLGSRPIVTRGEGREAIVVTAMVDQDTIILPLRNGEKIPSKPPLFHWGALVTAKVRGALDEFSIRFPSAVAGALLLAFTFWFSSRRLGLRTAILASAMLGTTFEFMRSATHARVDMVFALFIALSFGLLYLNVDYWERTRSYCWSLLIAAAAAMAAAVLSKGPAAILLCSVCMTVYFLLCFRRTLPQALRQLPYLPWSLTLLSSVTAAALWYWLAYLQQGWAFIDTQLLHENLARVITVRGDNRGHPQPSYMVPMLLLFGFLPWSLLLPLLLAHLWSKRKELLTAPERSTLFLICWIGTFLFAVLVSASKRGVYFLPAYPAAAMLFADALIAAEEKIFSFGRRAAQLMFCLLTIAQTLLTALLCAVFIAGVIPASIVPTKLAAHAASFASFLAVNPLLIVMMLITTTVLLASALLSVGGAFNRAALCSASAVALWMFSALHWALPWDAARRDPRQFMAEVQQIVPPHEPLVSFPHELFSGRFYIDRNIPTIASVKALNTLDSAYILIREDQLAAIQLHLPGSEVLLRSDTEAANGKGHELLVRHSRQRTVMDQSLQVAIH